MTPSSPWNPTSYACMGPTKLATQVNDMAIMLTVKPVYHGHPTISNKSVLSFIIIHEGDGKVILKSNFS